MDARYCALSRVSFGLIAGGAGAGSGDFLRAQSAPGRTGPAGSDTSPSALAHGQCGFSTGQCGLAHCLCGLPLSLLPARVACRHHLAGVGHCSLASGSSPQKDILTYPYLSYNIPNCEIFVGYERILNLDKVGYKRISLGPHCASFVGY